MFKGDQVIAIFGHPNQLASMNGASTPCGRHNLHYCRQWWGVLGHTLHVVLENIEGGNAPRVEYPAPSFSCRSDSLWLPRHMAGASFSSSGSHSSDAPTPLAAVKAEPQETPEHRRSHDCSLIINEGQPSPPPCGHLRLVKPKKEPAPPPVIVKQEHVDMAADLETGLKWAWDDYVREEMERQRRTLEEIAARRRDREDGGIIVR